MTDYKNDIIRRPPVITDDRRNSPSIATVDSNKIDSYEKRMQILETENGRLMKCQGQLIRETNRKLELYTNENRFLQYAFDKLKKQNQELRELCYFLDDERKATKNLHRELLESEKSNKQVKIKALSEKDDLIKSFEERERTLIEENRRLKTVCDSWIEFALKNSVSRDCPDGSSDSDINLLAIKTSGNNVNGILNRSNGNVSCKKNEEPHCNYVNGPPIASGDNRSPGVAFFLSVEKTNNDRCNESSSTSSCGTIEKRNSLSCDDLMVYVKSLELRVQQLEKELNANSGDLNKPLAVINEDVGRCADDAAQKPENEPDSLEILSPAAGRVPSNEPVWAEDDYEEISTVYMSRTDFYSEANDDNDNNNLVALSPIAEESETELASSSCSSLCDNESSSLTRQRNGKLSNIVWKCIDLNEPVSKIGNKSIRSSGDWIIGNNNNNNNNNNVFDNGNNNIHRYSSGHSDSVLCFEKFERLTEDSNRMDERKINNLTLSVDSLSSRDFLDHLSNNLQSTTI